MIARSNADNISGKLGEIIQQMTKDRIDFHPDMKKLLRNIDISSDNLLSIIVRQNGSINIL